jgi:uncharacterized protein YlxW (UPF0749 family)
VPSVRLPSVPHRLRPHLHLRRPSRWGALVPVVFACAGLLATMSAQTARGTDLRSVGRTDTADVIREQQHRADVQEAQVRDLRRQVQALTTQNAPAGSLLQRLDGEQAAAAVEAGTVPVSGPGVSVRLNDAPSGTPLPDGFTPDDVVVHQQDVQAVVNALWAAGAEAMMLMDQRVISTSAVRCVGNVLILQGRVYSPPYVVRAIGNPEALRRGLERSSQLQIYREYVDAVGLGYDVSTERALTMPGYDGSVELQHARAVRP